MALLRYAVEWELSIECERPLAVDLLVCASIGLSTNHERNDTLYRASHLLSPTTTKSTNVLDVDIE
jgi:hypothetical protein